jgi:hypothetical protein
MLIYRTMPLDDKTWYKPGERIESQFTTGWPSTLDLLENQIAYLGGDDVRIFVDVPASSIRNDGMVKVGALTYSPGVVVTFETEKHGELSYRSDRYVRGDATAYRNGSQVKKMVGDWQHNVRAIALGLEALRAIKRYGIADDDQQYSGFAALPAGRGIAASAMTSSSAQEILMKAAGMTGGWPTSGSDRAEVKKYAVRKAHPDRNEGDDTLWRPVEEAIRVLERAKML